MKVITNSVDTFATDLASGNISEMIGVEMTANEAGYVMDLNNMPDILATAIDEVHSEVFNAEPRKFAYLVIRVVT